MRERGNGISADWLKVVAMVTMLTDHIGAVLFPNVIVLRMIGRISFPIFVWLLVMGFLHTSNLKRYIARMALFAVLSEIPFDLALFGKINFWTQNIFFTLLLSLIMLAAMRAALDWGDKRADGAKDGAAKRRRSICRSFLCAVIIAAAMLSAFYLRCDYGCTGPALAAAFYLYARNGRPGLAAGFLLFVLSGFLKPLLKGLPVSDLTVWQMTAQNAVLECFGILSVPVIERCSGERRWKRGRYLFYLFYPLHLALLYWISLWMYL